ncbi:putative uncharacterized protein [Rhodococcus sp. AW25M09]|nr:putative uncharacterized protein [Rhodococcus sp. AW25M09]
MDPGAPYGRHPVTGEPFSDKQKLTAGLLNILLGAFGAGRFYLNQPGIAVAQIAVTWLTCGIGGIWPLIDGIMMLTGQCARSTRQTPARLTTASAATAFVLHRCERQLLGFRHPGAIPDSFAGQSCPGEFPTGIRSSARSTVPVGLSRQAGGVAETDGAASKTLHRFRAPSGLRGGDRGAVFSDACGARSVRPELGEGFLRRGDDRRHRGSTLPRDRGRRRAGIGKPGTSRSSRGRAQQW